MNETESIIKAEETPLQILKTAFENSRGAIEKVLPKYLTADRLFSLALLAWTKNPELKACSVPSIVRAVMVSARLGLEPDGVLGQGYLIAYKNKKKDGSVVLEAEFQAGYKGLITIATRTGRHVIKIEPRLVYERDEFSIFYGSDASIIHIPYRGIDSRGEITGAYAIATFKNGMQQFEFMTRSELDIARSFSPNPEKGAWRAHPDKMMKRAPISRLANYIPMGDFYDHFVRKEDIDPESLEKINAILANEKVTVETETVEAGEEAETKADRLAKRLRKKEEDTNAT